MRVEDDGDVEKLKELGVVARKVLHACLDLAQPGNNGLQMAELAEEMFSNAGVLSAPMKAVDFPAPICVSVNKCVAHGVPDGISFSDGDAVNVDVSITKDGYWVDTGLTTFAGMTTQDNYYLQQNTMLARTAMIHTAEEGATLRDLAKACQRIAKRGNYKIIQELGGHGTGDALHTEPHISNFPPHATGQRLRAGEVIAIEPLLSLGSSHVTEAEGGSWGFYTDTQAAQAEHTIIVPVQGQNPIFIT